MELGPEKNASAHIHESERKPSSSMLAQLMPVSGGFASSQLVSSSDEPIAISEVARQPERAAEREPVLMAIQLPDDLVVAARRIEIRHARPEPLRGAALVHRVALPIDGRRP